ncbi:SMI1/KNR4 family protein [Marinactinospora thermotolerans]|uniref:SMI1 / KNR4 family (SUKH-1) n=1 Tax=Marinactinospora thermotolerans DSM 45154 TaxID=1122192 RepID=A0A1T4SSH3_9ACTN|nr:SMI1/KNR4 family protein [Marinactinospora thermotolerans]SKA30828.1 SMI1 / KNR4 family (SUKH-1) [Marinactinospora thermotolerans DSM 45154]
MADDTAALPDTVEHWRTYLAEYSRDMLRVADAGEFDDEQRAAGWLGHAGATEAELTALEERLGTALPPSYRSFLAASNGWGRISRFMYELLATRDVAWLDDPDVEHVDVWGMEELLGRPLLISGDSDLQSWLLDSGDVSPDGEWAAYTWSPWNGGLGKRCRSFADLVATERAEFEWLQGRAGNPVHPEGAEELLDQGRRAALRGEVEAALDLLDRAEVKGSGAASYLKVILGAFLGETGLHYLLRGILDRPHVVAAIGAGQLAAEAVPLYLVHHARDSTTPVGRTPLEEAARDFTKALPELLADSGGATADPDAWIVARRVPEPPAFERALETARALAAEGRGDDAWTVVRRALPDWTPTSPNRVAPVVLLTDPALRDVVTPDRAREVVSTPRGGDAVGRAGRD